MPEEIIMEWDEPSLSAPASDPIRLALTWLVLGIAVIMAIFTATDLSSGNQALSLWFGLIAWPVVAITAGYLLRRDAKSRQPASAE